MITEPRTVTRRRFLARAGIVAASGVAVAGGATIAVRALSGPRDPADIVADVIPDDLPSEVAVSVLATVDGQERYRSDAARAGTVHDIASVTKQFTAAAIMKLDMLGEVSTGDRVGVSSRNCARPWQTSRSISCSPTRRA